MMGKAKEEWMAQFEPPFEPLKDDGFYPDVDLTSTAAEEAAEVIKKWFFAFFEDPANETPYNSSEGGYIYIWGGPYDAAEEVSDAFEGLATSEAIELAISEIEAEGYEWAPSSHHPAQIAAAIEYAEEQFEDSEQYGIAGLYAEACTQITMLSKKLNQENLDDAFVLRMLYAQSYSAIEYFLYGSLRKSLENSKLALANYCKYYEPMAKIKYSPSQVLSGEVDLKKVAVQILGKEIFHRFDNVVGIYDVVFGVNLSKDVEIKTAFKVLDSGLQLRHDCVHRNGMNYEGEVQTLSSDDIEKVIGAANVIVEKIDAIVSGHVSDGSGA